MKTLSHRGVVEMPATNVASAFTGNHADPVPGERLTCTLVHRGDIHVPAERQNGVPGAVAVTLSLLEARRGFLAALSRIYEVDLSDGFEEAAVIRTVHGSRAFMSRPAHRRRVVDRLCRQTLGTSGFAAIWPGAGMWHGPCPAAGSKPSWNEELALCHMFGSCGFAQLCHPDLGRRVPLFVAPWCRERGLLQPQALPGPSFSRELCVHHVGNGAMILFDKGLAQEHARPAR